MLLPLLRAFSLSILITSLIHAEVPGLKYTFGGALREEMFYGKNVSLLNNNNSSDKQFFARHILDVSLDVVKSDPCTDEVLVEFWCAARNKGVWGDASSIAATTLAPIKNVDAVIAPHSHFIPRYILWVRDLWLSCDVGTILALPRMCPTTLKVGVFSFQLGRGIALGDAFAVGPEILGFYTEANVDQFAPGVQLAGEIIEKVLKYDMYTAILNSRATTLGQTAEKIRTHEFHKLLNPIRGFGIINYAVAGRLLWYPINNETLGTLEIQPYWLYNNDPEQVVQFLGDATSKLGTIGLAAEYVGSWVEGGFDCAANVGYQYVKSIDRNEVTVKNVNSVETFVNTHVLTSDGANVPFTAAKDPLQVLIYRSFDNEYSQQKNGKLLTTTTEQIGLNIPAGTQIFNGKHRFRDPYSNHYHGWMAVTDAAVWLCERQIQLAATAGVASGDQNPNYTTHDGDYNGFIGLQEIYSGKRVRSAFVLGSVGKIRRPLSMPDVDQAPNEFADVVSGFTNLVFVGASSKWIPSDIPYPFDVQANVLGYWQEQATRKFSAQLKRQLEDLASSYLGFEANIFANYKPIESLRLYFVGSVFIPGQHYKDIKGLPLTKEQNAALDQLDSSGFSPERVPNLGDNVAYTFNIGMEFTF